MSKLHIIDKNKYHYVYKIVNKNSGKEYIGKRSCSCAIEEDDYWGSGVLITKAINKHGVDSFTKEILATFDTAQEAFDYEEKLVTEKYLKETNTYNIALGGGTPAEPWVEVFKEKEDIVKRLHQIIGIYHPFIHRELTKYGGYYGFTDYLNSVTMGMTAKETLLYFKNNMLKNLFEGTGYLEKAALRMNKKVSRKVRLRYIEDYNEIFKPISIEDLYYEDDIDPLTNIVNPTIEPEHVEVNPLIGMILERNGITFN